MNFLSSQETSDIQYVVNDNELNEYISKIPIDNYSLNVLLYDIEDSKNNYVNLSNYYQNVVIIKNMLQKKNNSLENTYRMLEKSLKENEFILTNLKNIIELMLNIENGGGNNNNNVFSRINFIKPENENNKNINYNNNNNKIINTQVIPRKNFNNTQNVYTNNKTSLIDAMRMAYLGINNS